MLENNAKLLAIQSELKPYRLGHQQFVNRFSLIKSIEDPYVHYYEICKDIKKVETRVAVRRYIADDENRYLDVLQNMNSYRLLGDIDGICKLKSFCFNQQNGEILAAFDYNEYSFEELIEKKLFSELGEDFYVFVLKEILKIVQTLRVAGIQVEEIILQSLLLEKGEEDYRMKILYDEREKKYDKIQEGLKVYASPMRIKEMLSRGEGNEHLSEDYGDQVDEEQIIFQIGLFLLDLMYEYEVYGQEKTEPFVKDLPLSRNKLSHKGYLIFTDSIIPQLNTTLVEQKLKYLQQLQKPMISKLVGLIRTMMKDKFERIKFNRLVQEVQDLSNLLVKDQRQKIQVVQCSTPEKLVSPAKRQKQEFNANNLYNKSEKQSLQNYSPTAKQNYVSQTTVATANVGSSTRYPHVSQDFNQVADKVNDVIPKHRLLSQIGCHKSMMDKFQKFIERLQKKEKIITKEYYDKSSYYGQVDSVINKRNGLGIYCYVHGDIYFGVWSDNSLVEGSYLFKNGQAFEGIVKGGKQGWGRYYYSNGNIYEGEWRNDVKCGKGKMMYPNGDVYEGMWSRGKKNGEGTYFYSNGTVYQGGFASGKKCGFGVINFPNKTKIQAYWSQTHIEGKGKVFYNNGNYFQGNYHLSEKQGEGLYVWEDTEYYGSFEKDAMEGYARIKFSDNEFYEGKIKNGRRCGSGVYRYANGDEFKGEWKNDEKLYGVYKFHEGGSFEGRFKMNKISYGVMVYENGESYEGEFTDGERGGKGSYRNHLKEIMLEGKWQRDQFISHY